MIAVKERISHISVEIADFKQSQSSFEQTDELLPETYFKLRYPDDELAQE